MATRTGSYGPNDGRVTSIGITMEEGEYPVRVELDRGQFASSTNTYIVMKICDTDGRNQIDIGNYKFARGEGYGPGGQYFNWNGPWTVSGGTALRGKRLALTFAATNSPEFTENSQTGVTVITDYQLYSVTVNPATGGSASANRSMAAPGTQITLAEAHAAGYQFVRWENNAGVTISGNTFIMPAANITITPVFQKVTFRVTKKTDPEGAGVITAPNTANAGDTVSVSQEPATGFFFAGWTLSNGAAVENDAFTMPAADIEITAHYLQRDEARLENGMTRFVIGELWGFFVQSNTGLTSPYTHKYRLNFGTGMDTGWVSMNPGAIAEFTTVESAWAEQIPNDMEKTGGTFSLQTWNGETLIGTYEITGLTYAVPASAVPTANAGPRTEINRTVDGITYANVGNWYVQKHCGANVIVPKHRGLYGATIVGVRIWFDKYSGTKYDRSYSGTDVESAITFSSGLLENSGMTTIHIDVTDSRGLVKSYTQTIDVKQYRAPMITGFSVWRVDSSGDPDDTGIYGQYAFTYDWTAIGTNEVHTDLKSQGTTETDGDESGWLMPATHQTFNILNAYDIELTIRDELESTKVTVTMESGKFTLHFSADGSSVAVGHAVMHTPAAGSGKTGTFEVDGDMEFFYGNMTLKEYILAVVNGTV